MPTGGTSARRPYGSPRAPLYSNVIHPAASHAIRGHGSAAHPVHRERRFNDGMLNSFDLYWDGADQLNQINVHGGSAVFGTRYNGDGQRVTMQDTAGGGFPTQHEFTLGLGGPLYDSYNSATYTPGVSQRVNGVDSYFHSDWLGSTRYQSSSTGDNFPDALRYDAFGNRSATGGTYDPAPSQFAADWGYQTEFASGPEQGIGLQYL